MHSGLVRWTTHLFGVLMLGHMSSYAGGCRCSAVSTEARRPWRERQPTGLCLVRLPQSVYRLSRTVATIRLCLASLLHPRPIAFASLGVLLDALAHADDGEYISCLSEVLLTMQYWWARAPNSCPSRHVQSQCKVGMLDEWFGEWMPDEAKYRIETVEEIKKRAIEANVTTDEGFCRLRNALVLLASIDGYWIKGKGSSHGQKRLLPPLDAIVGIDGVHKGALLLWPARCEDGRVCWQVLA